MSLLKDIMSFLSYRESPKADQFELLEEDYEGIDLAAQKEQAKKDTQKSVPPDPKAKKARGKKPILNVDQWNAERKQDSGKQESSSNAENFLSFALLKTAKKSKKNSMYQKIKISLLGTLV